MSNPNRSGRKKRELRNLVRRPNSRSWYWRRMVKGETLYVSLDTEDITLAKARRKVKEDDLVSGALEKLTAEKRAATLGQIFPLFERFAAISSVSRYGAMMCALKMVEVVGGVKLPARDVSLNLFTPRLVRDYQDAMRVRYEKELLAANPTATQKELTEARDRAERSSKSMFRQAKQLFARKHDLVNRYKESGLEIPACVIEFHRSLGVGSNSTKDYRPSSDEVLRATFAAFEALKDTDRELHDLFWCALGTGCRRNELLGFTAKQFLRREGVLWLSGGLGKDILEIDVPVISFPVHPSCATVPLAVVEDLLLRRPDGPLFPPAPLQRPQSLVPRLTVLGRASGQGSESALVNRLNATLTALGWRDEKKLHSLRSYIGSLLYLQHPELAQTYLRHKSLDTTRQHYTGWLKLMRVTRMKLVESPAVVQTPGAVAA